MLYLPNEIIIYILNFLDIKDLNNLLKINLNLNYLASELSHKKKIKIINNLFDESLLHLKTMYFANYLHELTHIKTINKLFDNLYNFLYTNIVWIQIDPYLFSFFLFEWVSLKSNGFDLQQLENLEYVVCKFRGNYNMIDKNFFLISFMWNFANIINI